jgi:hypothetical protein
VDGGEEVLLIAFINIYGIKQCYNCFKWGREGVAGWWEIVGVI